MLQCFKCTQILQGLSGVLRALLACVRFGQGLRTNGIRPSGK